MASETCEELMKAWFPTTPTTNWKSFSENDIRDIARVLLQTCDIAWSRVPRIYSVLRLIGQTQSIEHFLAEGITDVWFPFSQKSLPSGLKSQSARLDFLDAQHLVFNSDALALEQTLARHGHFRDTADIPLKRIGDLGKGGFGSIDRVVSTITHKEYARKLIPRGRTFRRDRQVLHNYERELSALKSLSTRHRHIVELIGSYTDPKYVGILMLPVADCNLYEFLDRHLDDTEISLLRTFFGCLTSALCFLHDSRIRHKDIKPQNVLIHNKNVFLADFGLSLDWSERDCSVTTGPTWSTPRYCAPEVSEHTIRSSSADVWSLGCVFLEMWTVLKRRTLSDLQRHMKHTGTNLLSYCANTTATLLWIEDVLADSGPLIDNVPVIWIRAMLEKNRDTRWTVHTLMDHIREHSSDVTETFAFAGLCCLDDEESAESVYSSLDDIGNEMLPTTSESGLSQSIRPHQSWRSTIHRNYETGLANHNLSVGSARPKMSEELEEIPLIPVSHPKDVLENHLRRRIRAPESMAQDDYALLSTESQFISTKTINPSKTRSTQTQMLQVAAILFQGTLFISRTLWFSLVKSFLYVYFRKWNENTQKCYMCGIRIRLRNYYNFAKCRCGAEFCMLCGVPWKSCSCPFSYDKKIVVPEKKYDTSDDEGF